LQAVIRRFTSVDVCARWPIRQIRYPTSPHRLSIAITKAKSEKEGLERRLDAARQQASIWLGNQTAEYLDREPESEPLLAEAEQNLIAGEKRIHQLKAHLDHLARVLELLTQK
jgi:hypothetical protein